MDRQREFKLGEWQVTPLRGVIHGPQGSRRITPKAMDVLVCLAQHRGEVVKREIFEQDVWDGRSFSDEPLNKCIAELRRKLGDSGTVWSLAHVYSILGRHDEAVDLALGFAVRFPSAGRNHQEVANRLFDAGRFDEALEFLDAALKNNAEPAPVADKRGVALVGLKKFEDALAQFEYAVDAKQRDTGTVARLAHVYGKLGRADEANALLAELELRSEREEISALAFAAVYAGLDDTNAALRYLDQAVRQPGREALGIANDPFFADLKSNAEFQRIVAFLEIPPL